MPGYMNNPYNVNTWNTGINPYGSYGAAMQPMPQSYAPAPQSMPMSSNVIPVDGEVGAKAYMVPNGSTGPIALWDTNDNVIYLRTFNAAGMPNPLKKLRYVEEEPVNVLPSGQSGTAQSVDTSKFATKDDFESLRNEIRQMSSMMQQNSVPRGNSAIGMQNIQNGQNVANQNGSNNKGR